MVTSFSLKAVSAPPAFSALVTLYQRKGESEGGELRCTTTLERDAPPRNSRQRRTTSKAGPLGSCFLTVQISPRQLPFKTVNPKKKLPKRITG